MPENPILLPLRGFTNSKQPLVQASVPIGDTSHLESRASGKAFDARREPTCWKGVPTAACG
jgi:hypothetical protein